MLNVEGISFGYDRGLVLEDLSFEVNPGEYLAIMGESGCGKSTLLKLLYGVLQPLSGTITWKDQGVRGPDFKLVPGEDYMKYLAQDFDLMPFLTVKENVSQYLSVFYPEELEKRTRELVQTMGLEAFTEVKVNTLSGGQQQRVALARVLAQKPEILLLDEPFSHIDNFKKNQLRRRLFTYLKQEGIACICATHDAQDVLPYADRVLIIQEGTILDNRPTWEVYEKPGTHYIASLFGEANRLPINILKSYADTTRRIIVYAHELRMSESSGLEVQVQNSFFMGSHYLITALTDKGEELFFHAPEALNKDKKVYLNIALKTINKRLIH